MAHSELTIQELGPMGDGVALGTRGKVYVDRAVPGDRLHGRIYRDEAGVSRAEVIRLTEASRFRQTPPCIHYEECGNCTLQHVSEGYYRRWKLELVRSALMKQGLRPQAWLPPVFLGGQNRRRATFSALKLKNRVIFGYYRRRSDEINDISTCQVIHPRLWEIRGGIKPLLWKFLAPGEPTDFFLHLVGENVDLVISGPEPKADVVREIFKTIPTGRVSWRSGDKIRTLIKKAELVADFGVLRVEVPPAAFLQPTLDGEKALVDAVMSFLPKKGTFADLFSGCGTFSGSMLKNGVVDAYEISTSSVTALEKAAKQKPLKVYRRDLFQRPIHRQDLNRYDAVVMDPPRAGAEEQSYAISESKVGTVISVSCNPATFARDARILCDGGYWLNSVKVIDQFLWSHHVEMVGVFTKRKRRGHK